MFDGFAYCAAAVCVLLSHSLNTFIGVVYSMLASFHLVASLAKLLFKVHSLNQAFTVLQSYLSLIADWWKKSS